MTRRAWKRLYGLRRPTKRPSQLGMRKHHAGLFASVQATDQNILNVTLSLAAESRLYM
jgi:hypothetical protein